MIKNIGGTEITPRHRASCHCGAVVLELELPDGIVDPRRCDCSLCLDGVNPFDLGTVPTNDGVNRPADRLQ